MPAVLHPSCLAFIAVMSVGWRLAERPRSHRARKSASKPVIVAAVTTKVAAAGVSTSSAAKTTVAPPRPAPKTPRRLRCRAFRFLRRRCRRWAMPAIRGSSTSWPLCFWVGEQPTENNPTPNHMSSWDTEWMKNFGGYDDPDRANRTDNFTPIGFTPKQNPFYIALPYNDVVDHNTTTSRRPRIRSSLGSVRSSRAPGQIRAERAPGWPFAMATASATPSGRTAAPSRRMMWTMFSAAPGPEHQQQRRWHRCLPRRARLPGHAEHEPL
jgi:hypothetical protein